MAPERGRETEAWLLLNASGLTPRRQMLLLEAFESPEAVFGASNEQLRSVEGIRGLHVSKLREAEAAVDVGAIVDKLAELQAQIVTIRDEAYPKLLKEIYDPPPVLFVRGTLERRDDLAVGIVGTRKRTPYGEMVAEKLAGELVRRGFTIVSGLAMGIDADAHRGALKAGGRTIGVLACGIDVNYPSVHAGLKDEIAASGAVITELALGTRPARERFPARNRIISGIALGVVVVEAPTKSGALITARLAAEQGREAFAVPGNVTSPESRGCHALIRDGVTLVEVAEDVVEGLGIMLKAVPEREPEQERQRKLDELPADQLRVLEGLTHQPRNVDDVIAELEVPPAQVTSALMLLEVKGLVRRFPGNQFVRI